jgi:hypothetical protein
MPGDRIQELVKMRQVGMRIEPGTTRNCYKCKWGTEDPTDPSKGQCVGNRTVMGGIWRRLVHDYFNTTCNKFEEGLVDWREHA